MANIETPSDKREFRCEHCNGKILIPKDLPPTTGPCPHCNGLITSPALESTPAAPFPILQTPVPLPQAAPAPVVQAPLPQIAMPQLAVSQPVAPPSVLPEVAAPAMPQVPLSPIAAAPLVPQTPVPLSQAPLPHQAPAAIQAAALAQAPPISEILQSLPQPAQPPSVVQVTPAPPPPAHASSAAMPPPAPPEVAPPAARAAIPEPPPVPAAAHPSNRVAAEPAGKPVEVPHSDDPSHHNKRKHKATPRKEERPKSTIIPVMLVLLGIILAAGVAVYFVTKEMGRDVPPPNVKAEVGDPAVKEAQYIRSGWKKEAYQVLRDYMAATSAKDKLPHILGGDTLGQRLEDFYGGGVINDTDTPADAFSIYELSEEDRKRGLFMMIYDQPPQFDMKEFFRPLATLEVQHGLDEADLLLSTLARVGNFAMEPLRVHAFFKRTPAGLKLDWEVFAQTKYRTLQSFVELPETGQSGVFRVFIVEDVPDKSRLEAGTRTYRIADPANTSDTARVNVKVDSEIGRALSIINWRGTKESHPITRTATIELKWTGDPANPQLEISRFLCWEFMGLGGQDSNATASAK